MLRLVRIVSALLYNDYNQLKVKDLHIKRAQYNKLSTDTVAKSLMWLKQSYYDQGEKCDKLLAWRLKRKQSNKAINSILKHVDSPTTASLKIFTKELL